jgi:hypothetical protein
MGSCPHGRTRHSPLEEGRRERRRHERRQEEEKAAEPVSNSERKTKRSRVPQGTDNDTNNK